MRPTPVKCIVRMNAGFALKFLPMIGRSIYEAVPDKEATEFESKEEADMKAKAYGLRLGQYEVCPVTPQPESTNDYPQNNCR